MVSKMTTKTPLFLINVNGEFDDCLFSPETVGKKKKLRTKINNNQNALKFFNERLLLVGYFDEDFENYKRQYAFRKRNFYEVTSDFPRLVASDLPIGLFDTKYNIELSAIEQFLVSNESILELIK